MNQVKGAVPVRHHVRRGVLFYGQLKNKLYTINRQYEYHITNIIYYQY